MAEDVPDKNLESQDSNPVLSDSKVWVLVPMLPCQNSPGTNTRTWNGGLCLLNCSEIRKWAFQRRLKKERLEMFKIVYCVGQHITATFLDGIENSLDLAWVAGWMLMNVEKKCYARWIGLVYSMLHLPAGHPPTRQAGDHVELRVKSHLSGVTTLGFQTLSFSSSEIWKVT